MAYRKIKLSDVPSRSRKSESRFEHSKEWKALKSDIDRGLAPQEGAQITLSDDDKERIGITNRRTYARFVRAYLRKNRLKYTVKSFNKDGVEYLIVGNEQVHRQIA